ncbi:MAG: hypothetical protein B6D64_07180 [Bacteroidetes bacterium 4484_276]|nr:MAG: hypothetical protein B6D64_07180 [Bacteroidetes bacterium 4484_276]
MKAKLILLILILLGTTAIYVFTSGKSGQNKNTKREIHDGPDIRTFEESKAALAPNTLPNDWMAKQRMYPYDRIKPENYLAAMKEAGDLQRESAIRLDWEEAGPTNIGGRITDIEIVPDNTDIMYIGAASGGIYKTIDGGGDWVNIFADRPVISIGDMALDPNNTDIIYAGTGEANSSSFSFMGDGMHKSYDAGATWEYSGLEQSGYIGRIIVDYDNSQRVYVAACGYLFSGNDQRGIYRSLDGGGSWERVLFLTDSTAAIDLVQHPENPDILYAAMWERARGLNYRRSFGNSSGIWKTEDGGDNWTELTNGLPTGDDVGRIGISIAKSNPNVLYAFYDNQGYIGVYKTTDGGTNWAATNHNEVQGMNSSFGWYFGQVRVDPIDADRFYLLGMELWTSDDGGNSYDALAGYWNPGEIHVDHHAMWIDEATGRIFEGNDGGLYYSENNGSSWTKINNLPITQFYAIDIDYNNPERLYGGTQDNNTIRTMTGDLDDWEAILGGDGMYTLVDYTDPTFIYAESQWGNLNRSTALGYNFNWIGVPAATDRTNWSSPYIQHPEEPSELYFGTYRVWKGTEWGLTWDIISDDLTKGGDGSTFHTITTIDVSKIDANMILTGSDDGLVHVTTNEGGTWTNISEGLPDRWITSVAFDPFEQNTIYATCSGFRWDEPLPHVFKSTNLGEDWIDISSNLPEIPVNEILCDPEFEDRYFLATDAGLFSTENGGVSWYGISSGMPNSPTVAMKIHAPTLSLVVGTYGNSMYRIHMDDIINHIGDQHGIDNKDFEIKVFPNPVKTFATIEVNNNIAGDFSIDIFDINGKLIRTLHHGFMPEGKNAISWDCSNNNGNLCSNGIYFCRISGNGKSSEEKIILMR